MIDLLYAPVKVNPTLRNRWVLVLNSKQNLTKLHLSRRGGGEEGQALLWLVFNGISTKPVS